MTHGFASEATLERQPEAAGPAVSEMGPGLLIFDFDGRLQSHSVTALSMLGLDAAMLHPGLLYADLRIRLSALDGDIAAALPRGLPPWEGTPTEQLNGEAPLVVAPRFVARWLRLDGMGCALVLSAAGEGDAHRFNEQRYREFAELAADWEWEMDAEARFTSVSGRFRNVRAAPPEALIGKTRWELVGADPDNDEFWRRHRADYTAQRPIRDFRYSGADPAGRMRHWRISGNPIFARDGRFLGYRGVSHDETAEVEARQEAERRGTELLRAKEAAELSEQRYREFAELAADWEWETDTDFRFTAFSERYHRFVDDYPRELIVGRTRWELAGADPERDAHWRRHIDDHLAHRSFRNFRYSGRDAKGRPRHFRVSGNPVFAPDGTFAGFRGVAHDETQELEARWLAERANDLLRTAVEALPQGFALYDASERLVMFNRALAAAFGANADILQPGRSFEEIIRLSVERDFFAHAASPAEKEDYVAARLAAHRNPGKPVLYQGWNGRWIEAHNVRTADGYVLGLRFDVTEREQRRAELMKAKEAAESSEARFREFTELASDWEWETDAEARFTRVSERYRQANDLAPEALIGKTRWGLMGTDPGRDPHWASHWADYQLRRPIRDFVYYPRDRSGRTHCFRINGNPMFASDGTFVGYRGVVQDETEQMEARDEARRAEMLLRAAIDALPEGFVLYDPQDRLVLLNRPMAVAFGEHADILQPGRTFEEIVRLGLARGIFPGAAGREEEFLAERLALHSNPGAVARFRGIGGRWIEASHVRTVDNYLLGLRVDVTDRVLAEQKLIEARNEARRAEALLRAAVDALPESFALYDPEDRLVLFNRNMLEAFGADADIVQPGRPFEEIVRLCMARGIFNPSARGRENEFIAERMAAHKETGRVMRYETRSGRWVEVTAVHTADGYTLGLRVDITDRLLAERKLIEIAESLAEKNRQLDLALENSSNGIGFHDADGRLVLWNRRYVELYNLPPEQLYAGMHLSEQMALSRRIGNYSEEEGKRVTKERLAILDSREKHVFRQTLSNGAIIEGTHVPLARGGSVSTYVDITERERRQRELVISKETAEYANRAKSDFLANVSHELRTPLNAVIGFSEALMLEYFGPLTEKQRDYLKDIRASGTFLLSLIDDLLDLTKIEVSKEKLSREPIQLAELVHGCCRMVSARFAEHAPQLRVDLPEAPTPFEADPRKLRQIIINLLTNAFKFTPPGGAVVLNARATEERIEITVSDSGIGISPDDLPRVTEPFYRAEGPFARRSEGAGLGLPLAKALAELHGGSLDIASELGVGTTTTLRLPRRS